VARIAMIFLRRPDGRWLIHQRRPDKRTYPSLHGLGAGGRIEPGESPAEGAARELWEETGLRMPIRAVTDFAFADGAVRHHVYLFEGTTGASVPNHEAEWVRVAWVTAAAVDRLSAAGQLCPDTAQAWALRT
jgi:8-oxo-dGTP pyrophosphatase MutT (NUDIX family)